METPSRVRGDVLRGLPVLVSASMPEDLEGTPRSQDLLDVLAVLCGGILSSGGTLVFGGHPSVTPLVHRLAADRGGGGWSVRLFQSEQFRGVAPPQVFDTSVFPDVEWYDDLPPMRDAMAKAAAAAVFVGGKTRRFYGPVPGLRDEYDRFRRVRDRAPAYLMGALGGQARQMADQHLPEHNGLSAADRDVVRGGGPLELAAGLVLADLEEFAGGVRTDLFPP
jgi:hypothetical protein